MLLKLPKFIINICNTYEQGGYEAWCVGGCVRDLLMGKEPQDYDIAVSARPEETQALFPETVPTGVKFGTVTILTPEGPVEATTFRADADYRDGRHPETVQYGASIAGDLKRRDFTINAMAYHPEKGLLDFYGGQADIASGRIACVGNPKQRFCEDALRILRAFRFSAQLDFRIAGETLDAAVSTAEMLPKISAERIYIELYKILKTDHIARLEPLLQCGGLRFLGLHPASLEKLDAVQGSPELKFAMLCRLAGADCAETGQRLKAPNKFITESAAIQAELQNALPESRYALKMRMAKTDPDLLKQAFLGREALFLEDVSALLREINDILESGEPYLLAHLAVTGHDLEARGMHGREIGRVLQKMLAIVQKEPEKNTVSQLFGLFE